MLMLNLTTAVLRPLRWAKDTSKTKKCPVSLFWVPDRRKLTLAAMRQSLSVAAILLAVSTVGADPAKAPVVERDAVHEVDPLIESAPGASDRGLTKLRSLVQKGGPASELHGKVLAVKTKSEASYVLKGNILDDLSFPEDAKKTYAKLLSIQPSSYWGHLNLGICELRHSDHEAAREALKKARDLEPGKASPYFNLARAARLAQCDYEERDALAKFLEVGSDDPRAEAARARLSELNAIDVEVDDKNPFATIALNEKLAHANWRSKKHRERFPDACGYVLTFEEEKEILSTVVLPDLRKAKDQDPTAHEPRYDVLLRVGDAGLLDEYIYDTESRALGAPALLWLNEHPERKATFEDWARKEGFIKDPAALTAEPDLPADVVAAIGASKAHYIVGRGEPADSGRFLEVERERFQAEPSLNRGAEIDCAKADAVTSAAPSDASRILALAIPGGTFTEGDGVHVRMMKPAWLSYLTAKAAWRNEPGLRKKYGGTEAYAPSVEEEVFSFRAACQGYRNGRNQPGATLEQIPILDRLVDIEKSGLLRGFVLYEVIHRRYGMTLRSQTAHDAVDVDAYLRVYVFAPAGEVRQTATAPAS